MSPSTCASSRPGLKEIRNSVPSEPLTFRPVHPVLRAVLLVVGTLLLGLGIVGIYVPGLPATPFLLLAAACYLRSSERLFHWLVSRPRMGPQLRLFLQKKAVPRRVKAVSLVLAWAVLGGLALFVVQSAFMKLLFISLALIKTVVMLVIPTLEDRH